MKDDLREALELAVLEGMSGLFCCDVRTKTEEDLKKKLDETIQKMVDNIGLVVEENSQKKDALLRACEFILSPEGKEIFKEHLEHLAKMKKEIVTVEVSHQ